MHIQQGKVFRLLTKIKKLIFNFTYDSKPMSERKFINERQNVLNTSKFVIYIFKLVKHDKLAFAII